MPKKGALLCLVSLLCLRATAQIGGRFSFDFLNLPTSARVSALGGVNITSGWDDVSAVLNNPALLTSDVSNHAAVNFFDYFADINQVGVVYAKDFGKQGTWAIGIQNLSLGEIQSFDATGDPLGTLDANDFAISISRSHVIGPFHVGGTFRYANASLGGFSASAILFDFGAVFKHPEKELTAGITVKNAGFILGDFTDLSNSRLPIDVQAGITFKPQYAPFRFSLTTYNLTRTNLTFFDPNSNLPGENNEPNTVDRIFRRVNIGAEIIISKNVNIIGGYNHLRRQELSLDDIGSAAGFSFGFAIKVKRFDFTYSRAIYNVAGGSNFLTAGFNFDQIVKKKNSQYRRLIHKRYVRRKRIFDPETNCRGA